MEAQPRMAGVRRHKQQRQGACNCRQGDRDVHLQADAAALMPTVPWAPEEQGLSKGADHRLSPE